MNNDVVIIKLDRERQVRFNHTALKTMVELTGKTIDDLDRDGFDVANFDFIEKMAYCGLLADAKENHETLTLERIQELLDQSPSFGYTAQKLVQAWMAAIAVPNASDGADRGNDQEPVAAQGTTGKKVSA